MLDHLKKINVLKTRRTSTLEALEEEPSPDSILGAQVIGFRGGSQKLNKKLVGELRGYEATFLKQRAECRGDAT